MSRTCYLPDSSIQSTWKLRLTSMRRKPLEMSLNLELSLDSGFRKHKPVIQIGITLCTATSSTIQVISSPFSHLFVKRGPKQEKFASLSQRSVRNSRTDFASEQ